MYELTYIMHPDIQDEGLKKTAKKVADLINKLSGNIHNETVGEKKRLSYTINKQQFGAYATADFEMPAENMDKLNFELRTDKDIVRHLMILKKVERYSEAKVVQKVKKSNKKTRRLRTTEPAKPKVSPTEKKVQIEEIDRKIEEILNE